MQKITIKSAKDTGLIKIIENTTSLTQVLTPDNLINLANFASETWQGGYD